MQAKKHVNERILGIFQHKTEMGSTSCHTKISCHDDMMDAKSDPQHAWKKLGVRTRTAHRPIHRAMYRPVCSTCTHTAFFACRFCQHRMSRWMTSSNHPKVHAKTINSAQPGGAKKHLCGLKSKVLKTSRCRAESSVFLMCRFWHVKMDGRCNHHDMPKSTHEKNVVYYTRTAYTAL